MKQLKVLVGVLISALAAWFALQGIDFGQVGNSFGQINWWLVALSQIPYFTVLVIKVTRWQLLFDPGPKIRLQRLWATLMISYLFNTVLPARLGEIVRGYALSRSERISPVRVFSTILLEKILDVMTMFIFLVALLPFLKLENNLKNAAFVTGGLVVAAFLVFMLLAAYRRQAEGMAQWFLKWLPERMRSPLFNLVTEVLDVLGVLLRFKLSLNLWAQSILMWLIVAFNYMLLAWALNLPMTLEIALVLTIALNLGMVVPSAPGYIGVFEFLVKTALLPFFPGQESLLITFGLLMHVAGYLPVIILGAFYTSKEGLSLGKVPPKPDAAASSPDETSTPAPVSTR